MPDEITSFRCDLWHLRLNLSCNLGVDHQLQMKLVSLVVIQHNRCFSVA